MLNITLDTCVWLKLLYIDFKNEDNYLEEICFWIENKHINHIVPANIIDEWNRHKLGYQNDIVAYFEKLPIAKADSKNQKEIEKLVNQLLQLNQEKAEVKLATQVSQLQGKIDYCEERINEIVYQLYELTAEEIKIVEAK